jgi:cytochrome c oxidase assembly protein subunit 11
VSGAGSTLRAVVALAVVAACAGGAAWAAWPQLGQLTGLAAQNPLNRKVTVRFAAAPEDGNPWRFRPMQADMRLRLGETGIAFYEAENTTDHPITGQAQYSVTPASVDGYFVRVACFCTTTQALQPHEKIEMPVTFFVDPSIARDPKLAGLKDITLSYTFHEAQTPERQAAVTSAPAAPVN